MAGARSGSWTLLQHVYAATCLDPNPNPKRFRRNFLCSMEAQRCDGKGAGLGIR